MDQKTRQSDWAALHAALRLPPVIALHKLDWQGVDAPPFAAERLPDSLRDAAPGRQGQYRAGRHCARHALARAGAGNDAPPMGSDGLPVWPKDWIGSISHTRGKAVALASATSHAVALGVDVECWQRPDRAAEIASSVARPQDIEAVSARARLSMASSVTLLFSAKESLYKALYPTVRRFFDFDAARLAACGSDYIDLALACDWHARWPRGTEFRLTFATGSTWVVTALHLPVNRH
ncbi:4'-phosphopantetheinyl transferase superfamily protein [Cupriavidus sp. BIS7]|uniref:4'-phosphopantetheinyl transferase family protein n=1 Tax=Cupriavidus sp. BIS7 TaxID=1217718 RepID=UPI00036A4BCB|nr:4'-phosphopantetheinyl transferase superfamily protein [Cupriavidus sp. BIS7]